MRHGGQARPPKECRRPRGARNPRRRLPRLSRDRRMDKKEPPHPRGMGTLLAQHRPGLRPRRRPAWTLAEVSRFRSVVAENVSEREAHRCIKIWRALWQVRRRSTTAIATQTRASGCGIAEPEGRSAVWANAEVVSSARRVARQDYHGLAAVIAVAWDTQPLAGRRQDAYARAAPGRRLQVARAKTGRAAIGTLSRARCARARRLYHGTRRRARPQRAYLPQSLRGAPYSKDTLGDDFRDVRALAFGLAERRTLADFRRTGTVEAIAAAQPPARSPPRWRTPSTSRGPLHKIYAPVDLAAVRAADEARKKARRG